MRGHLTVLATWHVGARWARWSTLGHVGQLSRCFASKFHFQVSTSLENSQIPRNPRKRNRGIVRPWRAEIRGRPP